MAAPLMPIAIDRNADNEQVMAVAFSRDGRAIGQIRADSAERGYVELSFRKVIAMALACDAHALAIAHTHPSGELRASKSDLAATRALARLCAELGIHFADHIILTRTGQLSFREQGLL